MAKDSIEPGRVTKPFQLWAASLATLIAVVTAFLTAATQLHKPSWLPAVLALAAIAFVLLFIVLVFLLQTRFRDQMQDDAHYSKSKMQQMENAGRAINLRQSQVSPLTYRVAVVNRTSGVPETDVRACHKALQTQVHEHLAPAWGVDAELTYCGPREHPPSQSWWLEITDDDTDAPEPELDYRRLVHRDVTEEGMPRTRVFVNRITDAGLKWTISASHTLLEMLVNPRKNLNVRADMKPKMMFFSHEIADPCTDEKYAYAINGVYVSDFVLPAWFDPNGGREKVDFNGHLRGPFTVGDSGYANVYEASRRDRWRKLYGRSVDSLRLPRGT
jgi:hypothetical protein